MGLLLFLSFVVLPAADLYLLFTYDWPWEWPMSLGLVILAAMVGFAVLTRAGGLMLRDAARSLSIGRVPTNDMLNGILRMAAGVWLLAPGFLSDILGILLLLPPIRFVLRGFLMLLFARRLRAHSFKVGWRNFGAMDSTEDPSDIFDAAPHRTVKPDIVVPPGAARPQESTRQMEEHHVKHQ